MINYYSVNQPPMILESDLAGEIPLYLYWPQDKTFLLYSNSIIELLNDVRVPKPLNVSCEGISFLLQSGVVPPPKTAYKGLYIIGIGDTAKVSTVAGKIDVQFNHRFPFLNVDRFQTHEMQPDEDLILKMLAEATVSRIDHSKQSFLFHSAGKDSNSIALALAEAGWQDKVTLITHKSKGKADESVISGKIAKKLGFKHETLYEVDRLEVQHKQAIEEYFSRAPFPCTDNVSLAYPLYSHQAPHLKDSNIIFGDGNDSHMMSPPNRRQLRFLPYAKLASKLSFLRSVVDSESTINSVVRTPAEWFGMSGLSFKDSKKIYSNSVSVHPYWSFESEIRKDWDIFDFKSDIYSTRTITERMIRKLFNFVAANNSQIVLPFANREVAEYFGKMPEAYLFDRSTLKNKLILREILKKHISLDSDVIGKMGWTYDSSNVVLNNWEWIFDEIDKCKLWDKVGVSEVVSRLKKTMQSNHKYAGLAGQLIYRIFLISSWFNHCRYLA